MHLEPDLAALYILFCATAELEVRILLTHVSVSVAVIRDAFYLK